MSRIAKFPIPVPKGVKVNVASGQISVKGPLGTNIARAADPNVAVEKDGDKILCKALGNSNHANAMSGTMRALVANMVTGVTKGFERKLGLVGVGYRAQAQGDKLSLSLGFSHPVVHQMPKGVKVATPTQTEIVITGIDKQLVGQVAAEVRSYRSPEPYKGKGVRYVGEVIVLEETKKKVGTTMSDKNIARLRRARQTRLKIREIGAVRLTVHRSNGHIYAQITSAAGDKVLASASTLDKEVRGQLKNGGNRKAAEIVGQRIAAKAKEKGIENVAFDRAGYKYHGRVKALAEAARSGGLKF